MGELLYGIVDLFGAFALLGAGECYFRHLGGVFENLGRNLLYHLGGFDGNVQGLAGRFVYQRGRYLGALGKLLDFCRHGGESPAIVARPRRLYVGVHRQQPRLVRDVLDADAMAVFTKEFQLADTLGKLSAPPKMVITDSQAFAMVSKIVPEDVPLTSFSILMARYKGFLETSVKGAAAIKKLKDGDTVLISEGCTHHRQCGDIGSVKLPALLKKTTGKSLNIELSSVREFPEDLSKYSLVIHCGGCMLNEREMVYRRKSAEDQNVPFTNYGIALALMNGILKRSLGLFPDLAGEIE